MTFDQYIQNPMGNKNAVMSNREMYRTMYTDKLNKILVRESGKVEYYLYKSKSKYYALIKVPSEVVPKFTYDVLIEFSEPENAKPLDRTLSKYDVRFYSNDPSFVFTFAHAFIENGLFIDEYKDKMSPEAVKQVATEKNPSNQVGYVKSLYFAYLIMAQRGLFSKALYVEKYNKTTVKTLITHATTKIEQRQKEAEELSKKKRKDKKALKKKEDKKNTLSPDIPIKQGVNRVVHTHTVNKISNTKTSTRIKRTTSSKK